MSIWLKQKMPILSYFIIFVLIMNGLWVTLDLPKPRQAAHAVTQMVLFWDNANGSVPTGWTTDATYNSYMIRGNSTAGGTGGSDADHSHTITNLTVDNANTGTTTRSNKGGTLVAPQVHTHNIAASSTGTAGSVPAYRGLMVMTYDAGVPTTLPAKAIVLFDNTGVFSQAGFTRYSDQDGKFIRGAATAGGTGGSNALHGHSTVSFLTGNSTTSQDAYGGVGATVVSNVHTHSLAGGTTDTDGDVRPPYVDTVLATVDSNGTAIPADMIAMFSGAPSASWSVLSDVGGAFYQKYMSGAATYTAGLGSATHTHAKTGGYTSTTFTAATLVTTGAPAANAATSHGHTLLIPTFSTANNAPAYKDVIVAKKLATYTPQMNNWQWYADEDDITPGTAYAAENTTAPQAEMGQNIPLKLRINITETGGVAENDSRKVLQYSTDGTGWTNVGERASTTTIFRYYNGGGADNVTLPSKLLSDSSEVSLGIHDESNSDSPNFSDHPASTKVEFEYTIEGYSMTAGVNYIFRLYDQVLAAAIPLASLKTYPTFTAAASFSLTNSSPPSVYLGTWALGAGGKHTYKFVVGEEITNRDNRGISGGNSSGWTCSVEVTTQLKSGANEINKSDMYWISYTTDITSPYDAPTTGMSGNSGELMSSAVTVITVSGSGYQGLGGFTMLPTIEIRSAPASGDYTSGVLTFTTI
jgi:hypothetical protein